MATSKVIGTVYEDHPVNPPTLCEVNYDIGGREVYQDDVITPYRYRYLRASSAHPDKWRGLTQSDCNFFEPVTVGCKTPDRNNVPLIFNNVNYPENVGSPSAVINPGRPNTTTNFKAHLCSQAPSRAHTSLMLQNPMCMSHDTIELSLLKKRKTRAKTAPLFQDDLHHRHSANQASYKDHLVEQSLHSMGEEQEGEKLVWVAALNSWVSEKQAGSQQSLPYLNFVNAMNLTNRGLAQEMGQHGETSSVLPCPRYLSHMNMQEDLAKLRAAQQQRKLEEEKRKKQERIAQMRLQRNQFKASQSAPTNRPKPKVWFDRPWKPPPPVKKSGPPPPPAPREPTPQPPSSPDSGLDEDTQTQEIVPQPVYLTQPLSDEEDQVDFSALSPRSPTPSPCPSPVREPSPSPSPPPTPSPPPREPTPSPPPTPPPPPPTKQVIAPPPEPAAKKSPKPKKKVTLAPFKPEIKHKKKKKSTPVSKTSHKEDAVKVKQPVVIEEPSSPEAVSRQSSALSRVQISEEAELELIVTSANSEVAQSSSSEEEEEEPVTVEEPAAEEVTVIETPALPKSKGTTDKRERWRAQYKPREKPQAEPEEPARPEFSKKRTGDWIFGDEDFSTSLPEKEKKDQKIGVSVEVPDLPKSFPTLTVKSIKPVPRPATKQGMELRTSLINSTVATEQADYVPPLPEEPRDPRPVRERSNLILEPGQALPEWARRRWGPKVRDTSWADELERQRLAEERRARAQAMLDKLHGRTVDADGLEAGEGPDFDEYEWLAKYCILPGYLEEMYRKTFEVVDEGAKGWLSPLETIVALRATNRALTEEQEEYVYRILQLTGYNVTSGADFKLFSVLAALSQKITALDEWMKNLMVQVDFRYLEMKLFMCRTLWECSVDPETNTIPLEQLCVELRAGGVSYEHELEVRGRLAHLQALDLLDFLTYIPLFIMLHESIVDNPLDDTREK